MARLTKGASKLVRTNMKFIVDPTVIPKLATAAQMGVMLEHRADKAAEAVRSIAPVGDSPEGEHYRDQIEGVVRLGRGGLIGRVIAKKFTAVFLEFGTSDTPVFAPLRRGVEMIGLRLGGRR